MRLSVYSTRTASFWLFLGGFVSALALGCGGGKHKTASVSSSGDGGARDAGKKLTQVVDAGSLGVDSSVDAGMVLPGDPPPELAGSACAVDTNKLYNLVSNMRQPQPTQLAVDLVNSHFGLAYVDKSTKCIDAVFMADLHGASGVGMPDVSMAFDDCTTVDSVAITHAGDQWLIGSVDARKDERDLWVQPYMPGSALPDAQRVTMSLGQKREVALSGVGTDSAIAAWVEQDTSAGTTAVNVRMLASTGEPQADAVEIESSGTLNYAALALEPIGSDFIGLGYRRFDGMGRSEIVFQVLSATTGKPDRDAWVLTTEAGAYGSVDLSTDDEGGGIIYSIIQGTSEQLWFQRIDLMGHAAAVTSGGKTGGPSAAVRVVGPPYNAIDASLAKLPNGFVVAYRVLPGGQVTMPRIRVHFIDRFGRVIGNSDVALAQQYGGRTAIDAAYDGRAVVAWSDQDADGKTTTTAVKLPCFGM